MFRCVLFSHKDYALKKNEIKSYAAWSKDDIIRNKCSSGGIGFELARTLLKEGFKICGVQYSPEKKRAEHYIATTEQELMASIGSKYIQSYTVDGFKAINKKDKYLVTGTPCQIDSFRRYIQQRHIESHFILIDFFVMESHPNSCGTNTFSKQKKKSEKFYTFLGVTNA